MSAKSKKRTGKRPASTAAKRYRRTEARLPMLKTIRADVAKLRKELNEVKDQTIPQAFGSVANRVEELFTKLAELEKAHAATRSLVTTEPEPK